METSQKNDEVGRALVWFADYAQHLELAIPMFLDGGPDANWQERARELDATLRDIHVESLREAAASPEGRKRTAALQRVQASFEAAIHGRLAELSGMISTARRGQKGLLGYARAGRLTRSSAQYIERQL